MKSNCGTVKSEENLENVGWSCGTGSELTDESTGDGEVVLQKPFTRTDGEREMRIYRKLIKEKVELQMWPMFQTLVLIT